MPKKYIFHYKNFCCIVDTFSQLAYVDKMQIVKRRKESLISNVCCQRIMWHCWKYCNTSIYLKSTHAQWPKEECYVLSVIANTYAKQEINNTYEEEQNNTRITSWKWLKIMERSGVVNMEIVMENCESFLFNKYWRTVWKYLHHSVPTTNLEQNKDLDIETANPLPITLKQ